MRTPAAVEREEVFDDRRDLVIGVVTLVAAATVVDTSAGGPHRQLHGAEPGRGGFVEPAELAEERVAVELGPADKAVQDGRGERVEVGECLECRRVRAADEAAFEPADRPPREPGGDANLLGAAPEQGTRLGQHIP